jgi:hypothetical protein
MRNPSTARLGLWVAALTVLLALPASAAPRGPGGGPPGGEATGNNLSFPVLWAEGVTKVLRGTPGMTPVLLGAWWYWWGTDPADDTIPLSCAPDPDDVDYCDDGKSGSVNPSMLPPADAIRVYLQQDAANTWQAASADASAADVLVDWIDWGDNLESSDWYLNSQVRVEVVLLADLDPLLPMTEYGMRHLYGWGQTEMHGVATAGDPPLAATLAGLQATIYSHCARLTIQRLLVPRETLVEGALTWVPGEGWTETDPVGPSLINSPIFNKPVWETGDGPGYYSAEINVKGKIIYGYTWGVRKLNDGVGDYRVTFSFDGVCGTAVLNTFLVDGVTEILVPVEELTVKAEPTTGGVPVLDFVDNLTYIDVRVNQNRGGGRKPK